MSATSITPHFSAPFSLSGGVAAVDDQDTPAEIEGCVSRILNCFIGDCAGIPTLGIPNQLFANAPLDVSGIQRAVATWEPRADVSISESGSPFDPSDRTIEIARERAHTVTDSRR